MNRILLFLSLSLTIIACSKADHYEGSTAAKDMIGMSPALEVEVPRTQEPGAPSTFEATPRKLIRTGSMHCDSGADP